MGSHTGDSQVLRIHATAQSDLDQDTLRIPSNIPIISSISLQEDPRSSSAFEDEDVGMDGAEDRRPGKSGKIIALKGTYIEILDRLRNLAPIHDAVMADTDGSGQVGNARSLPAFFSSNKHTTSPATNRHLLGWSQHGRAQSHSNRC